jgi:hypothetical protein
LRPTDAEAPAIGKSTSAKLCRKERGGEAKLCLMDHALLENRCGLLVDACLGPAGRFSRTGGGALDD